MRFFLTRGQILSLATDEDTYCRGQKYYTSGKVLNLNLKDGPNADEQQAAAKVSGNYKNYNVAVVFTTDGVLKRFKCECHANTIWRGACKHVVATLLYMLEGDKTQQMQLFQKNAALELLSLFEKQAYQAIDTLINEPDEGSISLIPSLHIINDKDISLGFTIGAGKQYVIKSLDDFVTSLMTETVLKYGKDLEFRHSFSAFDQKSRKLAEIIVRERNIYTSALNSIAGSFRYLGKKNERIMAVNSCFDEFFTIYNGLAVKCNLEGVDIGDVLLTDTNPDIKLLIEQQNNSVSVSCPALDFRDLRIQGVSYVLLQNHLHRLTDDFAEQVLPLLTSYKKTMFQRFVFTDNEIQKFGAFILPILKRHNLLDESSSYDFLSLSLNLKKKLYFDAESKAVFCKVMFEYDTEKEINPLTDDMAPGRNAPEESKILHMLKAFGFNEDKKRDCFTLSNDDKIYELHTRGIDILKQEAEVYATDEFNSRAISRSSVSSIGLRVSGNLLELSAGISEFTMAELLEALGSYSQKKKYHRLKNGKFIELMHNEAISGLAEIVSTLDITKKDIKNNVITIPKYRALYLDSILSKHPENNNVTKDENLSRLTDDFKNITTLDYNIPDSLKDILRDYQRFGFKWIKALAHYGFGGILADDMGLGKTLQVITVLLSELYNDSNPFKKPSIVVAPTSLIYNWESEIKKFAPQLSPVVIAGLPAARKQLITDTLEQETDRPYVLITTYDMLKRDIDCYAEGAFRYIIADEAQYIKNPATQNACGVKKLKGDVRLALTGTPIENSLMELWSIFDFIMPGYLYTSGKFSRLYETPIIKNDNKEKAQSLQRQISPFILRRLKSQVLKELPEKVETDLFAVMTGEQKKIYALTLLQARGELDEAFKSESAAKSQIKILAQLTRLRQVCCHPALFIDGYSGQSSKLTLAMETITGAIASGCRVLLFSQFTSMLSILIKELVNEKISYYYLDGATDSKLRAKMVEDFNNGEKDLFLISLKAGGTGLNLTGADVVIHYDPWWNPAVMTQATDRAHRFGQKKMVQVFNLVTKDSIEEKIMELQVRKKDLVDSFIKEGGSFIGKMSLEEIKELFT